MLCGMMWGACWGDNFGVYPGLKDVSPCGSTLVGGTGYTSGVASGLLTLLVGVGAF